MRSEEDLLRTMRAASEQAGHPDLARGVAGRRRARRIRRRAGMALAAAAVVVAGGMTVTLPDEEPVVAASPQIRPVADVWPRAVVKVWGRDLHPVTALSATEVLLITGKRRLEVYDSATGRTRALGDLPYPKKDYHPQRLDVGAKYIAWFGQTSREDWADFWIMPREGGKAERVGEVAADVEQIGLTDDAIVWSVMGGGVYRMPLTGGTPERLPGTDGLHLTTWPWAQRHDGPGTNATRIVNLETGRATDVAVPAGAEMLQCHVQWCTGLLGSHVFAQRADGSERRQLPGPLLQDGFWWLLGDRYARFRVNAPGQNVVLYDLSTGTMAELGDAVSSMVTTAPPSTVYWKEGDEYTIVNLMAVTTR
ncbi:hypothetical protein SAMN05444920_104408 [Nonomuraea solani]|uniref:Uncharacterized protein n=1 Tax=Nonomuraea solani TaxID=1144553 RepID=A0A1H6CV69_9ACTN|nr:hypothetical protein [Nonomuraea solani]SEG76697.1 hypothetical protein SAMN05444920_104408 [Nonomuraea solani]